MKWWRGALGLQRDGFETKTIIYPEGSLPVGMQDGDNLRRNLVTVSSESLADRGSQTAIGLSAVYACINLLAGTIGSLPLMVYRTDREGVRTVAKDHPLYYVLHDSPNFDQTSVDF